MSSLVTLGENWLRKCKVDGKFVLMRQKFHNSMIICRINTNLPSTLCFLNQFSPNVTEELINYHQPHAIGTTTPCIQISLFLLFLSCCLLKFVLINYFKAVQMLHRIQSYHFFHSLFLISFILLLLFFVHGARPHLRFITLSPYLVIL